MEKTSREKQFYVWEFVERQSRMKGVLIRSGLGVNKWRKKLRKKGRKWDNFVDKLEGKEME